ncbi:hypothetical protein VTK56DRAFT_4614 [Thermocarpiscus australiensis]
MTLKIVEDKLPLTEECRHYSSISEVPWDLQKYWHQRYSIFSFYDYDIRLTDDAWFGVTPEPVATKIAKDIRSHSLSHPPKDTIVDLFAGAGGNTIALALSEKWDRVIAVEKDAATLACAQHNAAVYGVADAITWVLGDSLEYLARLKASCTSTTVGREEEGEDVDEEVGLDPALQVDMARTVLFASPPWGGVSYRDHEVFDLGRMEPYNLEVLHAACRPMEHVLYLPRTSDLRQIARLAPGYGGGGGGGKKKIEVVQYCMEGASKAMVAYIPASE